MGRKGRFPALLALCLLLPLGLAGCGGPAETEVSQPAEAAKISSRAAEALPGLTLTVNGRTFSVTLEENPAAEALLARLPQTLEMAELNGNEKYFYFDEGFPVDGNVPQEIRAGELMLYGDDCLVLFYRGRENPGYPYTRLGAVEDPAGLAEALGSGSAEVSFAAGK